jgi:TP901 family phage tail tape measure protein
LLAVFGQFNLTLSDTGRILDTVNQFAADFAVESKDIFEGVKRGGSAFAVAGGQLEDFIGLFSLLRSATRESADTLGVFFKTGLGKLLSDSSQSKLALLGVGKGSATSQLTQLGQRLFQGDISSEQRVKIAIDLVGDRQFGRLLTLANELQKPENQKRVQESLIKSGGSVDRSIAVRLDDVGASIQRVGQSFTVFVEGILLSPAVKSFAKSIADSAASFSKLGKSVGDLLPLFTNLGLIVLGPIVAGFARGALARLLPAAAGRVWLRPSAPPSPRTPRRPSSAASPTSASGACWRCPRARRPTGSSRRPSGENG